MNKAEKMKKLALSMRDLFKRKDSFDDKRVYRFCLTQIKAEAAKGRLECAFHIVKSDYNNVNIKMVAEWLKKDGFEVMLTSFYASEIDKNTEFIEDWKMKVSWE
jgi:hypothetical protein